MTQAHAASMYLLFMLPRDGDSLKAFYRRLNIKKYVPTICGGRAVAEILKY